MIAPGGSVSIISVILGAGGVTGASGAASGALGAMAASVTGGSALFRACCFARGSLLFISSTTASITSAIAIPMTPTARAVRGRPLDFCAKRLRGPVIRARSVEWVGSSSTDVMSVSIASASS